MNLKRANPAHSAASTPLSIADAVRQHITMVSSGLALDTPDLQAVRAAALLGELVAELHRRGSLDDAAVLRLVPGWERAPQGVTAEQWIAGNLSEPEAKA